MKTTRRGFEIYTSDGTIERFTTCVVDAYRAGLWALDEGAASFQIGESFEHTHVDANGSIGETTTYESGECLFKQHAQDSDEATCPTDRNHEKKDHSIQFDSAINALGLLEDARALLFKLENHSPSADPYVQGALEEAADSYLISLENLTDAITAVKDKYGL